ncbi:MAG TPA: hypothetical protein VGJ94_11125 [Syntrophorhabdaceae bacterium]|jgi:hypothetical protein
MSEFVRIKHYVFNLETITYIRVTESCIDFGFTFPTERPGGPNFVRLEKGSGLSEGEFEEVKEFVLSLPDPDRVIVV